MPDPGFMLRCIEESWQQLLAAADALPAPKVGHKTAAPARRARAAGKSRPARRRADGRTTAR